MAIAPPISPRAASSGLPALRASSSASSSWASSMRGGDVAQDAGALPGRERPPRGQRRGGSRDRLVGLRDAGAGECLQDLLRRRFQDGQRLAHGRQCAKGPRVMPFVRTAPVRPAARAGRTLRESSEAYGASGNFGGSPISAARAAASSSAGEWNVLLPLTAHRIAAKMITAITVTGA